MVRWDLKIAIVSTCGNQRKLARRIRIEEAKLSHLVQGHDQPTERERKLLEKALGRDYFSKEGEESQSDERRAVMGILVGQGGALLSYEAPKPEPKNESE